MEPKSVFASTTNWAALVALLGAVLPLVGIELGIGASEDILAAVGATATAGGAIWVLVERFRRGDLYIKRPKP